MAPWGYGFQRKSWGDSWSFSRSKKQAEDILGYSDGHILPLYATPPAPEAEKLRVAVEALGEVSALRSNGHGDEWESGFTQATIRAADIADQALAALQQEGR